MENDRMNMESLWERTCVLLSREMNYVSYSTWIDNNMVPGLLEDDTLFVAVKMDKMISMIQNKYADLIEKKLFETAGKTIRLVMLTKDEMREKLENGNSALGQDDTDPHLNPKYTFESFVVGNGNRFAHAAALAVAESPAEAYNPLFIYGGVGLGKTHLMQAIGHFIHQTEPKKKILYMTSENFTNELISAIQLKKTYEFREKIRKVDVLMVDDIQFIAGRESTQQEFFNTFNELHNDNKQIILTSDKPPKDIQRLEERLCSRFEWGLVADIQRPDVDTRVAILREKTVQENITVPDDVLQLIAGKIDSNIRELEGCLTRLVAYSTLVKEPITLDLCERALKEIFDSRRHKQITAELIMQTVCDYYGLIMDDMTGPTRKREITVPRQIAMYLTREMTGMSLPQIGNVFGGRDHTTVLHSCKTVEGNMTASTDVKAVVEDIKNLVKNAQ
uniref:Chromosomal replication initiator protein DnaA n=1 Tax=uncultured bacterium Contigcl_1764b TaxID=1393658 RepID=W0FRD3_9BACT|nr:chromosomal replication initiator protein DnaA [uncultured bacterium Contigcl_1764b]